MVAIREILLVGCILALGALGKDFKETKDIDLTENKLDEDVPEVPDKWARKRPSLRPTKQPEVTAEETTSQEDSEETELCRNGKMQSPIALSQKNSVPAEFEKIQFTKFDVKPESILVTNDNHSINFQLKYGDEPGPTVSGGPLFPFTYNFAQFHFHWGPNDSVGSEHTLNGQRFPLELHMVFYNSEFADFNQAKNETRGLTVFGLFYQLNRGSRAQNQSFSSFLPLAEDYTTDDENKAKPVRVSENLFSLQDVTGQNLNFNYLTYNGSLTTPECYETVTWILPYAKKLSITQKELNQFRRTKYSTGDPILSNYRMLKKINDRVVLRNTKQ